MEKRQLVSRFLKETEEFERQILAFEAGQIDRKAFKGISGGFGCYAQKESGYMLRFRLTGGRISKDTLVFLYHCAQTYKIPFFKLTSCQTIQAHDLNAETVVSLMRDCLKFGIITKGCGGDHPRNVMVSPLSGLTQEEPFDVYPYAETVSDYLIRHMSSLHMPRKLKTAFSNTRENAVHATFRDLGFVAQKDGTFSVYCAGGLGPNPKLGILVERHGNPEEVTLYVSAMIRMFSTYGNYETRAKARTRYLQDTLGPTRIPEIFREFLEEARKKEVPQKIPIPGDVCGSEISGSLPEHKWIIPQKQPGLYSLLCHPVGGRLTFENLETLYQVLTQTAQGELRLSPDGTIFLVNFTAPEIQTAAPQISFSAENLFETSTCCIGVPICQHGLRNSQKLLQTCVDRVRKENFRDKVLPRIAISGCPSSCGAHQAAVLGFVGHVKKTENGRMPAFRVFLGGSSVYQEEQLGEEKGVLLEQVIPDFLADLGRTVENSGELFETWYPNHREELVALIQKYAERI